MKIISLNTFFGTIFEPLMCWVEKEAPTTDIFCFQEIFTNPKEDAGEIPAGMRANLLQELARHMPDFNYEFAPMQDDFETKPAYAVQTQMGIAIFYRKTFSVTEKGDFFIDNAHNSLRGQEWETLGHNAMYIALGGENPMTIMSLHGNSEPAHKRDTPKRILQSQKVLDFLAGRKGEKIVMGDFNLFPDTESIAMFEKAGFRNLITENGITTTRGSFMRKLYPQYEHGPYGYQDFADYTFVTPGIEVKSFEVPETKISDHLPMVMEII